jgi:DNA-binding NarL/FixJ family response regulator
LSWQSYSQHDQAANELSVSVRKFTFQFACWICHFVALGVERHYSTMTVSILLGEDQPVVVAGLKVFFQSTPVQILQVFQSPSELDRGLAEGRPQVIVSETKIADCDMLTELGRRAEAAGFPRVVFFSKAGDPISLARALAMSAFDFVYKTEPLEQLLASIEVAARAETSCDPSRPLQQRRVQLTAARLSPGDNSPLTRRETQVLRHVAMGLSNREIGKSLGISVETIKEHVQNILRKLDVNDRTQAAIWALKRELV